MTEDASATLTGLRVLVLEDEALVSMLLESMIEELGGETIGPFIRLPEALDFIGAQPAGFDVAILDLNIAGQRSFPVAEKLQALGAPFAFSTGYDGGAIDPAWRDAPRLSKPFDIADLEAALRRLAPLAKRRPAA